MSKCSLNGCQNRYMHDRKPSGQITIASGTRNGRGRFGRVKRRISTPMLTTAKASSVPIDTMSPRKPTGSSTASTAASTPTMMVTREGGGDLISEERGEGKEGGGK